ncbi:MAG: hypothetical protein HY302_05975 [Opitutae bacterium]|nr:hypothetical protein [Opitutae bacterium]
MSDLLIRLTKRAPSDYVLTCVRADGSTTTQRTHGESAKSFPFHDLTHFAVETVLGHRQGFYGLVCDGWQLADFTQPGTSARLPDAAVANEALVGLFDGERASGTQWTAAGFNDSLAQYLKTAGRAPAAPLSENDLARVRAEHARLAALWHALPVGGTLELAYARNP